MNVVLPRPKRVIILFNLGIISISQFEAACKDDKDFHHGVKDVICDAIRKDQTTKCRSGIFGIVDMDIAPE